MLDKFPPKFRIEFHFKEVGDRNATAAASTAEAGFREKKAAALQAIEAVCKEAEVAEFVTSEDRLAASLDKASAEVR